MKRNDIQQLLPCFLVEEVAKYPLIRLLGSLWHIFVSFYWLPFIDKKICCYPTYPFKFVSLYKDMKI